MTSNRYAAVPLANEIFLLWSSKNLVRKHVKH
jgi:hypothetical protein